MATYTAGDLINRALRLLGVLASGEQPEASESNDSIMAFNQMIDSWSLERLSVYGSMEQVGTWPAGQATQSLGAGGIVSVCPVLLGQGTYFVLDGTSYTLTIINREQYSSIAVKTLSTQVPRFIFPTVSTSGGLFDPVMEVTLYTVPSQNLEMHFVSVVPLNEVSATTDTIYVPKGYYEAYVYNLALRLAPEFGVEPSRVIKTTAAKSRVNLKRINNPNMVLNVPGPLLGKGWYNIETDGN